MAIISVLCVLIVVFVPCLLLFIKIFVTLKKKYTGDPNNKVIAFFHPYCNAGGGGERVLWCAVKATQEKYPNLKIIIYTGDKDVSHEQIIQKAKDTFNLHIVESKVNFVFLRKRHLIEDKLYPRFTMIGQSIGSIVLAFEALFEVIPDIYIDTMGYAFTLPIFKYLGGCYTACYVHYPTISTDMLTKVKLRESDHNNDSTVAKNKWLSFGKLIYYKIFAKLYSATGRCSDCIMTNGTWTNRHINSLWSVPDKTTRLYPPCDVSKLKTLKPIHTERINIVSISQFRPEKNHALQLLAMAELKKILNDETWKKIKLILVGSCRNSEDLSRVEVLKSLSNHLSLEDCVEFRVNVTYDELLQCYQEAMIGIHTMWNEHFGIGIVECMAVGLIMVAHHSGGPLDDIIDTSEATRTGYLATTPSEYAECIKNIINLTQQQREVIQNAARYSVDRFSEATFENGFLKALAPLLNKISM